MAQQTVADLQESIKCVKALVSNGGFEYERDILKIIKIYH